MKSSFSTGEAARLCHVSQQTIIRCFDSEQLKGSRVPGSNFRRIGLQTLYEFMIDHQIPTDLMDRGPKQLICLSSDSNFIGKLKADQPKNLELTACNSNFNFGLSLMTVIKNNPIAEKAVLLDLDQLSIPDTMKIVKSVKENLGKVGGQIIAVTKDQSLVANLSFFACDLICCKSDLKILAQNLWPNDS